MGKFRSWERPEQKPRPWTVHPIWRGIGCIMIVLLPLLSYAAADILITENGNGRWYPVPQELTGPVAHPFLYAKIALGLIIMVLGFVLLMIVYSLIYRVAGPPRYSAVDAKPTYKRSRKRRR